MHPISEIIEYLEKNLNLKLVIVQVTDSMMKFSADVTSILEKHFSPFNSEILNSKQVKKLEYIDLNPFSTSYEEKLPFSLKYVARPLKKAEHVDFGDHEIFYASGGIDLGTKYLFNLPNHENYKLYKTTGIKNINDLQKIYPFKPMQEFFDVEYLAAELENKSVDKQDKKLILAQLLVLHSEYRARMLNVLKLSVDVATCTSKTGQWQIRPNLPRIPIAKLECESLHTDTINIIANDIKKYFHLEKIYGLNLLGETPDLFDKAAIIQLFDYFNGHAVIQENAEHLDFLSEDIGMRHQLFKDLMNRNYPKQVMIKVWADDELELIEGKSLKLKRETLEKIIQEQKEGLLSFENSDLVILKILTSYDECLKAAKEFNIFSANQTMPLENFAGFCWLKSKACSSALFTPKHDLEVEIYELVKELLNHVPTKEKKEDDFENLVDMHFQVKEKLNSKISAYLILQENGDDFYEKAADLIKEIISKLEAEKIETQNDPWSKGDHFWKTFAEGFLEELEEYLTNLNTMPSGEKLLENQLVLLKTKLKFKTEVSKSSVIEAFHIHLK